MCYQGVISQQGVISVNHTTVEVGCTHPHSRYIRYGMLKKEETETQRKREPERTDGACMYVWPTASTSNYRSSGASSERAAELSRASRVKAEPLSIRAPGFVRAT